MFNNFFNNVQLIWSDFYSDQWSLLEKIAFIFLFTVVVGTSSHLWFGDLLFHTDVARDFLVLQEIVATYDIPLIGPRAGGIEGVFHGPLWYYIQLPVFVLVQGSPVAMGWFWWLCGVIAVGIFIVLSWWRSKNVLASLIGAAVFSLLVLPIAAGAINTFFAELFSFLVFFLWWYWLSSQRVWVAALGWLGLGVLVQFQMAFAVPILVLMFPVYMYKVWHWRLPRWQFALPVLAIVPMATFIVFDVRHDWLQTRAVIRYLQASPAEASEVSMLEFLWSRLQQMGAQTSAWFGLPAWVSVGLAGMFAYWGWQSRVLWLRNGLALFGYWYFGWWVLSLAFGGSIWGYYVAPFTGIAVLLWTGVASVDRRARYMLALVMVSLLLMSQSVFLYTQDRFDSSSWKLLSGMMQEVLSEQVPQDETVGLYLYSQDQFAYPLKYAAGYEIDRLEADTRVEFFAKHPTTILILAGDDPNNPFMTRDIWRSGRVRIDSKPERVMEYPFSYSVEVYELDEKSVALPSDSNIIQDLHFR